MLVTGRYLPDTLLLAYYAPGPLNTATVDPRMNIPEDSRFISRLTRETLALVLAGGRGSRLKALTRWRAKPAVPFGGTFRIIDFTLSNCIHSDIRRIGVVTQYKSHSLIRHLQRGWSFLRGELGECIEMLPASQRRGESWYAGTADAVYQNFDIIMSHNPKYILVLAGDHIYKMDYGPMLAYHARQGVEMTVACLPVAVEEAHAYGVMEADDTGHVTAFHEKPAEPRESADTPGRALCSMGLYVFNAEFLYSVLEADAQTEHSSRDFGKDVIPSLIAAGNVAAFPFKGLEGQPAYWRDVGTVDAFWQANMELVDVTPELNLYDERWPIWTHQPQLPPAKFVFDDDGRRGMAVDSVIAGGCIVSGAAVRRSLLSYNVRVNSYSTLEQSVVLPEVEIGRHSRIKKAVIDKGCRLPEGTVIGEDPEADAERFWRSPGGVTVVTAEALGQGRRRH